MSGHSTYSEAEARAVEAEVPRGKDEGLHAVLMKVRYDLTAAQGKLTEAIRVVASLDLDEVGKRAACPNCGATFPGPQTLAEHLYTSHGGPVPAHWLRVDELAQEPKEVA